MARFTADQADNYGGNGGSGFFSLRNDKDQAQVRFMYDSFEDVEAYSVHRIPNPQNPDRSLYVNCLREYNDPVEVCPFCADRMATQVKLFIPIYDEETGQTKTWDRGKKFISKIESICNRYPNESLASHTFTIERNGEAGDKQTTYEIWETGKDDTTLEDLPDKPNVPVQDRTAEEMEYYLAEGCFEDAEDGEDAPTARPSRHGGSAPAQRRGSVQRRTPANRGRSKETF